MTTNRMNNPSLSDYEDKFPNEEGIIPPYGDDPEVKDQGEINRLMRLLKRAKQPDERWRKRAMKGWMYYHSRQWTKEDKAKVEGRGQAPIVINKIKPTVNMAVAILAQPVKWLARPVGDHDDDFADSATAGLMHIAEVGGVPEKRSRSIKISMVYGVGYLMPGLYVNDDDPRREKVQVRYVDPREIRLDPDSKELDLTDLGYFVWSRKVLVDQAKKDFKGIKQQEGLDSAVGVRDNLLDKDSEHSWGGPVNLTPPRSAWDDVDWNQAEKEGDYDSATKSVVLHELWEKVRVKVWLLEQKGGITEEFDPSDPQQATKVMDPNVVRYYQGEVKKVRCSIFAYNILLEQYDSPYKHDELPLVAYFYDRDENGDPESFVDPLLDMQDEVNHRRSKMLWELSTLRLRVDPSVAASSGLDFDDLAEHAARPDALFIGPADSVEPLMAGNIAAQQFQLMQDSKQEIMATAGINESMLGMPDASSRSASAKQVNLQQGQTQLKPADFNIRVADQRLGELLFSLIQQYHNEEWEARFTDEMGQIRTYTLNQKVTDPQTGLPKVLNDIDQAKFVIKIDTMPWTPGRREYIYQALTDMAHNETDALLRQALHQAAMSVLELPNKQKVMQMYQQAQQQQQAQAGNMQAKVMEQLQFGDMENFKMAQITLLQKLGLLDPQSAQMYRQQAMTEPNPDVVKTQLEQTKLGIEAQKGQMQLQHEAAKHHLKMQQGQQQMQQKIAQQAQQHAMQMAMQQQAQAQQPAQPAA